MKISEDVTAKTVKAVIDTSNLLGLPRHLVLEDVPVPVSSDYLVAQMRANGQWRYERRFCVLTVYSDLPEPRGFSTRRQVHLRVVNGRSSFDPNTLRGCIN